MAPTGSETATVHGPYGDEKALALNNCMDAGKTRHSPIVQSTASLPTPRTMKTIQSHFLRGTRVRMHATSA